MKFCDYCGKPFDDDVLVCDDCGYKFPVPEKPGHVTCAKCGTQFAEEESCCPFCGASVGYTEERSTEKAKSGTGSSRIFFLVILMLSIISVIAIYSFPVVDGSRRDLTLLELLEFSTELNSTNIMTAPFWLLLVSALCMMCAVAALLQFKAACSGISCVGAVLMGIASLELTQLSYMSLANGFWIPLLCMISGFICSRAIEMPEDKK